MLVRKGHRVGKDSESSIKKREGRVGVRSLNSGRQSDLVYMTRIQGWVIQRRRIIRRIVFITYLTVFFKLLRILRFWALNEFCSHKPPRAPQKHSQAL
jgi:hypothetical protein